MPVLESRIDDGQEIFDDALRRVAVLEKISDIRLGVMSFGKLPLIPIIQFQQWRYVAVVRSRQVEMFEELQMQWHGRQSFFATNHMRNPHQMIVGDMR